MSNIGFTATMGPDSKAAASGAAQWNAGTVASLGTGLSLNAGVIDLEASQKLRTIPFSFVGTLVGGQPFSITITQAGTLLANGGAAKGFIPTNPTAQQALTLRTINSGTIATQGTVTISTAGSITWPTFAAVPFAAGDTVQLVNQATSDTTFQNACLSLQYQVA